MWNQRSRALWIKCGDRNTKFFHATANQGRRTNKIKGLRGADEVWYDQPEDIEREILEYFSSIFSTASPSLFATSLDAINPRVSVDMNVALLKKFSVMEVWKALHQMHPTKAPGPDSMSPIFYQKYWDVVGNSVTNSILQLLNTRCMSNGWNETYICLIPKVSSPPKNIQI